MANDLNHRHQSPDSVASRKSLVRRALAACAVVAVCQSGSAFATTFQLGAVNGPTTFSIGNAGLFGEFSDTFSFEIGAAGPFEFDAFASTGFSNRFGIPDLQAALYANGHLLRSGFAETVFMPEGFPSRDVGFAPLTLAAGRYGLLFSGTAISFVPDVPLTSAYSGSIDLAPVSAIPEPSTLAMTALGIVALIASRRRRA